MKSPILLISIVLVFVSCSKSDSDSSKPQTFDFSCQQYVDALGNQLGTSGSCSGPAYTTFSSQEIALFTSLDTTNVLGAILPTSSPQVVVYPNPFYAASGFHINFSINSLTAGQVVVKFVLTDNTLNAVFKGVARLSYSSPNSNSNIALLPVVTPGLYRLYYSFNSQSENNSYRSWINLTAQ